MLNVTVELVSQMFPNTRVANIAGNLPFVLEALNSQQFDRAMLLMALGTIRAETESFRPLAEARSRFNTAVKGPPFGLYDHRADLGNQGPPDGQRFRGRGYVQLTGRFNYQRIGAMLNMDLIGNPDLACDPASAAAILAAFLKQKEAQIRQALALNDLPQARRLVNGGSNGLARFRDAYDRGVALLPAEVLVS